METSFAVLIGQIIYFKQIIVQICDWLKLISVQNLQLVRVGIALEQEFTGIFWKTLHFFKQSFYFANNKHHLK